jgi:hypothetical protein
VKAAATIHPNWKVRPPEVGRSADCGQEVAHGSKMEHLFDGNAAKQPAPLAYLPKLGIRDALVRAALQAERGEQIAAHHAMLDFGRLGQEVDQLRTVLYA